MVPLFSLFNLGPVRLSNRIVVSPMCQYSADDGCASDWHRQHLPMLSGAGLVMTEATHVERHGRITHGCLGLYSDANEAALDAALTIARRCSPSETRFGVQLAHSGRKGSVTRPWQGGGPLTTNQDHGQSLRRQPFPSTRAGPRHRRWKKTGSNGSSPHSSGPQSAPHVSGSM